MAQSEAAAAAVARRAAPVAPAVQLQVARRHCEPSGRRWRCVWVARLGRRRSAAVLLRMAHGARPASRACDSAAAACHALFLVQLLRARVPQRQQSAPPWLAQRAASPPASPGRHASQRLLLARRPLELQERRLRVPVQLLLVAAPKDRQLQVVQLFLAPAPKDRQQQVVLVRALPTTPARARMGRWAAKPGAECGRSAGFRYRQAPKIFLCIWVS